MAKLKTPLLSLDAHGTVGDAVTFQGGGKGKFARKKPVPADPKSPLQLAQRQKYRDAVAAWHALSYGDKKAWRGVCPGLTAYQCFMRSELKYVPPPPEEYTEEQSDYLTHLCNLRVNSYIRAAQRLTISNRTVTKLAFYIKRIGSPTGNITFTMRKVSDDSIILSKAWGDAGDLPTEFAWQEVTFDTPATVNEEVRICVEFSGGGVSNEVGVTGATSDVKAGEWFEWYTASWAKPAEWDFAYIYTYYLP